MRNQVKIIECEQLQIAASAEGRNNDPHPYYAPKTVLLYMEKGTLHFDINGKNESISGGTFLLIRKFVKGIIYKTWTPEEEYAQMYGFILHDEFVKTIIEEFTPENKQTTTQELPPIYQLPENLILKGLFESIISYIEIDKELDKRLIELKTREAVMGILKFHPECFSFFQTEKNNERADLTHFIETHYMFNVPLARLATLSGRSLSTFSREFKALFQESPHKWILKRRLHEARSILMQSDRKPIDFYIDLGFESIAHFSRAFKKEYGITLTDFRKKYTH